MDHSPGTQGQVLRSPGEDAFVDFGRRELGHRILLEAGQGQQHPSDVTQIELPPHRRGQHLQAIHHDLAPGPPVDQMWREEPRKSLTPIVELHQKIVGDGETKLHFDSLALPMRFAGKSWLAALRTSIWKTSHHSLPDSQAS